MWLKAKEFIFLYIFDMFLVLKRVSSFNPIPTENIKLKPTKNKTKEWDSFFNHSQFGNEFVRLFCIHPQHKIVGVHSRNPIIFIYYFHSAFQTLVLGIKIVLLLSCFSLLKWSWRNVKWLQRFTYYYVGCHAEMCASIERTIC